MDYENNIPVEVPEDMYAWLIAQAAEKKITVEDLTATALNHYRAAILRAYPGRLRVVGF